MPFSIEEFHGIINKYGLAQSNRFEVMIPPPSILKVGQFASQIITAYCDSSVIPGIGIQVNAIPRYGIGPTIKKPIHAAFNDWSCVFSSDIKGNLYKFFHQWIKSIYNFSNNGSSRGVDPLTGLGSYEMAYKDDYKTDITISIFDTSNKAFLKVKLFEAFPFFFQDTQLSRENSNDILKFSVSFSFREWTTTNLTNKISVEPSNPIGLVLI